MNITKMKLTLVGICGLILVPFTSHASTATLINDTTALFTIDFSFTDKLFEVQVPIATQFNAVYADRINTVGYTITTPADEIPEITNVQALVLSTADIKENKYHLEKGETGNFTLMILASFAEELTTEQTATITKLPYWLNERRTTMHQSNLDRLATPSL